MEREATKDNMMMKEKEESAKFINFFDRKSKLSDAPNVGSVESKDSSDVLNGRHPVQDEPKEHPPTIDTNFKSGQGLPLRGSKRHLPGETESPAKRQRKFNVLLNYWVGLNLKYKMSRQAGGNITHSGILPPGIGNLRSKVKAITDLETSKNNGPL